MPDEVQGITRRTALAALARTAGAFATGISLCAAASTAAAGPFAAAGGRVRQSVCRWPYARVPLVEFCRRSKSIGLEAVDLLFPDEWSVVRQEGLGVSMGYASRRENFIERGFNDPANHSQLLQELEAAIPLAANAHVPNLIAMFGNRVPGIDEQTAGANCAAGLAKISSLADRHGVTICLELLNSKLDHPGYQGDHTSFGASVIKAVNSPRVKLLYDIYHMQIMEGDVIRTIRGNIQWIGHFHTGGVPGRHEINGDQELNYRAIVAAIANLDYRGFLAHEFAPTRSDPFQSLAEAYRLCAV